MAASHKKDASITFFPVGNADTSLITLSDDTKIVIDLNVTLDSKDEDGASYDVHGHLLRESRSDDSNIPHIDAFVLSHPDQDHLRGFTTVFYDGDPAAYSDNARKAGRSIIAGRRLGRAEQLDRRAAIANGWVPGFPSPAPHAAAGTVSR